MSIKVTTRGDADLRAWIRGCISRYDDIPESNITAKAGWVSVTVPDEVDAAELALTLYRTTHHRWTVK